MKDLLSFEFKKIITKKACFYIIIAAVLMNLFFFFVTDLRSESYSMLDHEYKGIEAIAKEKSNVKEFTGELTDEKIAKIHKEISLILDNPKNYVTEIDKNKQNLIDETKIDMEAIGYTQHAIDDEIKSLKLESEIWDKDYQKYVSIHELIDSKLINSDGTLIPIAKAFPTLEQPLIYDYHTGYDRLIRSLTNWVAILLCIIVIVCISPVFADEYGTGTDAVILTTRYGKNKVVSAKIISSILFSITIFVGFALLNTCLYGFTYGLSGGNVSVFLDFWSSGKGYALTYFQQYIAALILGLLGTLFLTAITLLLSSKLKTAFSSIIMAALIAFIPAFDIFKITIPLKKIFDFFPINIMSITSSFNRITNYNFFGTNIYQPYVMLAVALIGTVVLMPFAYRGFSRHQV